MSDSTAITKAVTPRPAGTPIAPGVIARITGAVRYVFSGKSTDFFGPGTPLPPAGPEDGKGRRTDYPTLVNTATRPRSTEGISFPQLRAIADAFDIVRMCIETRKDQLTRLEWMIAARPQGGKPAPKPEDDPIAQQLTDFFQSPDKEHDWADWLRMAVEELLVIDAPTFYRRPTKGGGVYAIEVMDGATFVPLLDEMGRRPAPPAPAYQQFIKGVPAWDFDATELLYVPRNVRSNRIYGFAPVEQLILIINLALRREVHALNRYTEGNLPAAFATTPATWNPDMIARYQEAFDAAMVGDLAKMRRLHFLPSDTKVTPLIDPKLVDEMDEWIARIVCYAFGLPPNAFVKQQNRATAESAQEVALEEGLAPLMAWVERTINRMLRDWFNQPNYRFSFVTSIDTDPLVQAQIDQIYVNAGVDTVNEVREARGKAPIEGGDEPKQPTQLLPPGAGSDDSATAGAKGKGKKKGDDSGDAVKKKRRPY